MPLRETLQTILTDYPKAKSEPLEAMRWRNSF
jgi:hypothetical protein